MLFPIPLDFNQDSQSLDGTFGFRIQQIEELLLARARQQRPTGNHHTWGEGIHEGNQSWVGLDPQTLLTPYAELKMMCEHLSPAPDEVVIDLGAGYGRLGIVLAGLYPGVNFHGFELVPERVEEGRRVFQKFGLSKAELTVCDLTAAEFEMPAAHHYFIYDYGKVSHIRQTLNQLSKVADSRKITVIGRGKGTQALIDLEYPWLSVHPVIREKNFSVYSSSI